jgi:pimeloyl-ACP methyl ester carboxylesterase
LPQAMSVANQQHASLLLVHGAGSGPWIFDDWYRWFPQLVVSAVDLQADVGAENANMADYARVVVEATKHLPEPVALCGWSMGGLVALLASHEVKPRCLLLIEPSPPVEVQGFNPDVALSPGVFDPEEVYGRFPAEQPGRAESSLARAERKRGISVPTVPCPSLVVSGSAFTEQRGRSIARLYGSGELSFPYVDHWGLVTDARVPEAIAQYLSRDE